MSGIERRRLFCAVLFHLAAGMCVIWSLCVLIERAAEEVKTHRIGWPFYTKLIVVTVGLSGGLVFMYIQCKQYLNLCSRWRARNRILLIQNAPEKIVAHQSSPTNQTAERSSSMRRNNSSRILVITAPLNNVNDSSEQYCSNQHQQQQQQSIDEQRQQSQIIANIESNYDDDSISYSQISFKQHLRQEEGNSSRGSLHNVYDNTSVSTTSATTNRNVGGADNDSNFLKMVNLEEVKEDDERQRIQKTSIFLENSDILNDQNYPKLYYHSAMLLPTSTKLVSSKSVDEDFLEQRQSEQQSDKRRYSDTKLLNKCHFENELKHDLLGSPLTATERQPIVIRDFIIEKSDLDPTDLKIQKILEMDINEQFNAINSAAVAAAGSLNGTFQSMPNLKGED